MLKDKCILSIEIKINVRICECKHLNTQVVTARQISVLVYESTFFLPLGGRESLKIVHE